MSFIHGAIRLRIFQRLGPRQNYLSQKNLGALSKDDLGDSVTEPRVYRSRSNVTFQIQTEKRIKTLLREEKMHNHLDKFEVDESTQRDLSLGSRLPQTMEEERIAQYQDNRMLKELPGTTQLVSPRTRSLMTQEAERRRCVQDKYSDAPTSRDFHGLLTRLRDMDDDYQTVEKYQQRLVEENGIYPETRMEAYMLGDEICFPEWVDALPYRIRDQVKFGSLGITELEETMRIRLGRLPRDQRIKEWTKIKKGRQYQIAMEETLTFSELRDARIGKKRFHWLLRKRQRRASSLRRLSLRKPDTFDVWPSGMVDYSQRIAFIAQHVENGMKTNGKWPLEEHALLKAKQDRATHLESLSTVSSSAKDSDSTPSTCIEELLKAFDLKSKHFKRVSRKTYANRVNAIVHGDQDQFGRNYNKMKRGAVFRQRAVESFDEVRLEKEIGGEVVPNDAGLRRSDDHHWPRHMKNWVDGMPSMRYGS